MSLAQRRAMQEGFGNAFGSFFGLAPIVGGAAQGISGAVGGVAREVEKATGLDVSDYEKPVVKATENTAPKQSTALTDNRSFEERFEEFREKERAKEMGVSVEAYRNIKKYEGKSREEVKIERAKEQIREKEVIKKRAEGVVPYAPITTAKDETVLRKAIKQSEPGFVPSSQRTDIPKITTPEAAQASVAKAIKIEDTRTAAEKLAAETRIKKDLGLGEGVSVTNEFTRTVAQEKQFREVQTKFEDIQNEPYRKTGLAAGAIALSVAAPYAAAPIAAGTIASFGIGLTAPGAYQSIVEQQKNVKGKKGLGSYQYRQGGIAGFEALESSIAKKDALSGFVASSLLVAPAASEQDRQTFFEGARQSYIRQGFSKKEATGLATQAVNEYLIGGAGVELASLGTYSKGTEQSGRYLVKQFGGKALKESVEGAATGFTRKQAAKLITKPALKGITLAGIAEGAGFEVIQSGSRLRKAKPEDIVFSGAVGGVSAGLIGTFIARTAITKPRLSKAVMRGLYVTDPTEKIGDYLADRAIGNALDLGIPIKTVVPTGTITPAMSESQTKYVSKKDIRKVKIGATTYTGVYAPSFTQVQNQTKAQADALVKAQTGIYTRADVKKVKRGGVTYTGIYAPSTTKTPTGSKTITNIIGGIPVVPTPVPVISQTPTPTPTQTETTTQVTTGTPTTVTTPVSAYIPVTTFSGFPLLPGGLPFGSGGKKARGRQQSKIVNELAAVFRGYGGIAAPVGKRRVINKKRNNNKRRKR